MAITALMEVITEDLEAGSEVTGVLKEVTMDSTKVDIIITTLATALVVVIILALVVGLIHIITITGSATINCISNSVLIAQSSCYFITMNHQLSCH